MNIFEQASRTKLRFPSSRGELTVEQLWDLPLQSKSGFDLDTIAKAVNKDLKSRGEESFVSTSTDPVKTTLELSLEILKHIIQSKQEENSARLNEAKVRQERERIAGLIDKKQNEALEGETLEQLQARLAALK